MADTIHVGDGSHMIEFDHREVGTLRVYTGVDQVEWGYGLNTAQWPTYGGQVVQILSCFVDNISITGTLQTYSDMEDLYGYFLRYIQVASQGDQNNPVPGQTAYNQEPMTMTYAHRGWTFSVMPLQAPGCRWSRDLTVPQWRIQAHIVDEENDVSELSDLIIREVQIADAIGQTGNGDDTSFGLKGTIKFIDDNPFSDPFTAKGKDFANKSLSDRVDELSQWYNELLPSYLKGDFNSLTDNVGSQPAFGAWMKPPTDSKSTQKAQKTISGSVKTP